jgi:hypothetical protein
MSEEKKKTEYFGDDYATTTTTKTYGTNLNFSVYAIEIENQPSHPEQLQIIKINALDVVSELTELLKKERDRNIELQKEINSLNEKYNKLLAKYTNKGRK